MKNSLFLILLLVGSQVMAQKILNYQPLDISNPIEIGDGFIIYQQDTIHLGPNSFFVDGQLTAEETSTIPYVFNTIQEAAKHLVDGTEAQPMTLFLAPYVYWIDNPDDPGIREPEAGDPAPYGMKIKCEWLRFYGLSPNPQNVVLACNRGQTIGARGNFTLFRFSGEGTSSENITFGNYCNVDLEFPLKPELSREKRATAIVQAQLIHCDGDRILARNTHFISRLNLCPFVGGKRVLFDRCHFESTDDALCATGVYLNSTFDFYSSKPFYYTRGTGAVLLNCDIRSFTKGEQYFVKAGGQLAVVDTRFSGEEDLYVGWRNLPPEELQSYQYGLSLNGQPLLIGAKDPNCTVSMDELPILDAYRIEQNGQVIYNTYNLLRGEDEWDPMQIKTRILEAEKNEGKDYSNIPTQLLIKPSRISLETGKDTVNLTATLLRFGNYKVEPKNIRWELSPSSRKFASLMVSADGKSCQLIPENKEDEAQEVIVMATTPSGLRAVSVITVTPLLLEAPEFSSSPQLAMTSDWKLLLNYQLATDYEDQSVVTWYRCKDIKGTDPIPVAVSRFDKPLKSYSLAIGDVGCYLMASIAPKHIRSVAGEAVEVIMTAPIKRSNLKIDEKVLHPDFAILSTTNQERVIPGFWTWKHLPNTDQSASGDAWYYGKGRDGAEGIEGLLQGRSGFMSYTPVGEQFDDMKIELEVAPFKSAGQGFSIAPLHMDVLIKFDSKTMTGYGLRIKRTTKYGNAVDFVFVKYEGGDVTEISEPVSASCYRTHCKISLAFQSGRLLASATTDATYDVDGYPSEVLTEIKMETEIHGNTFGGFGIWYMGGASAVITDLLASWD